MKIQGSDGDKKESPKPEWAIVLHYELEIRKRANELIQEEGMDIETALTTAWKDPELRGLHFVTPYLRQCSKVSSPGGAVEAPKKEDWRRKGGDRGGDRYNPYKGGKDGKYGKGKSGKGKGDKDNGKNWYGLSRNGKLVANTPLGPRICFKHNKHDANDKCDGNCGMEHVCRVSGCYKTECQAYRCPMLAKELRQTLIVTPL